LQKGCLSNGESQTACYDIVLIWLVMGVPGCYAASLRRRNLHT
jgi:hypothetical protein